MSTCKRYLYTPGIGAYSSSCNTLAPYEDIKIIKSKFPEIVPLKSTTPIHRLRENDVRIFDKKGERIYDPDTGGLKYNNIFTAKWFTLQSYYNGLPSLVRTLIDWGIYIGIFLIIWKFVIRYYIGPPGVLIATKKLKDDNISTVFYNAVNRLKIPRKLQIGEN